MDQRLQESDTFADHQNLVSTYNIMNKEAAALIGVFELDCEQLEGVDIESIGNELWQEGQELLDEAWVTTKKYAEIGYFAAVRARFWAAVWSGSHMTYEERRLREGAPFFV